MAIPLPPSDELTVQELILLERLYTRFMRSRWARVLTEMDVRPEDPNRAVILGAIHRAIRIREEEV